MELYLMRHGVTVWNERRRTQGRIHNRLSKAGIEAVSVVAFKTQNIKFDYIFTSPLLRAVQTANLVKKYHNAKIIKDERLTDIDQGWFTGKYFDSLTEEEKEGKRNKEAKYNMETTEHFYLRIKEFFNYLKTEFNKFTVLVVTHSGGVRLLEYVTKYDYFDKELFKDIMLIEHSELKKII